MSTRPEDQLTEELCRLVDWQPFTPNIEEITRRGRRLRRKRIALRGATGLGLVAVAATGALIGMRGQAGTGTAVPRTETAAYVAARAKVSLASAPNYIIKIVREAPIAHAGFTLWTDPRTGNSYLVQGSGPDKQAIWSSPVRSGNDRRQRVTIVDFGRRTWSVQVVSASPLGQPVFHAGPQPEFGGSPAQVRALLGSGTYHIAATRQVGGHPAAVLRGPWGGGSLEIWIDLRTFQPERFVQEVPGGQPAAPGPPTAVTDETWLPRTPALVDLINHPQIPPGFTQARGQEIHYSR
jgi:hypothetical protein